MTQSRTLAVALAAALALPGSIRAQEPARREIPRLEFRKDGVWRRQARSVRAQRARLLAGHRFGALNAPLAAGAGGRAAGAPLSGAAAVSGVLGVPAVLFKFKNTPATQLRNTTEYNDVLFAPAPTGASAGRPYTYASWYAQLSNNLLNIQGATYGYAALDSNEVTYTGASGTCSGSPIGGSDCNGLFSNDAFTRMQNGLRLALKKIDAQVDWTQYDSDGDGYVDLVAFIPPPLDGACGPAGCQGRLSGEMGLAQTARRVAAPAAVHTPTASHKERRWRERYRTIRRRAPRRATCPRRWGYTTSSSIARGDAAKTIRPLGCADARGSATADSGEPRHRFRLSCLVASIGRAWSRTLRGRGRWW